MRVVVVVEGHGEVDAVPVLLRRLAARVGRTVHVPRPIRIPRGKLVKETELRRAVELAGKQTGKEDAILVLVDADGECPAVLGPQLLAWARDARRDRSIAVVVAKNEFEAWFVAAAASLAAAGRLHAGVLAPTDPESIQDAKGWLDQRMQRRYSAPIDQPAFAATFDIDAALCCDSFDKLVRDVSRLMTGE